MKKLISTVLAAALTLSLAACGSTAASSTSEAASGSEAASTASSETASDASDAVDFTGDGYDAAVDYASLAGTTIKVAASPVPHAEILKVAGDILAKADITLDVVEYTDYVQPNLVTESGEVDANYFQHTPYLESFNASNNTKLAAVAKIHYEPFGIYGNGITDLKDLKDGATIIIPADDSNETRALFLLAQENLIKLADGSTVEKGVTTLDIVDDGGYNITAVQADTVAAQLKNADAGSIAVINGNYALAAGLKIADALASEDASGEAAQTYANIVAVRKADVDSAKTKALVAALTTQKVKDYINNTYNGAVVPIF